MGQSATCTYRNGQWLDGQHRREPYLVVSVHDSSVAVVEWGPSDGENDTLFLGHEPRDYFGEPAMHERLDTTRAARGFATWVREVTGRDVDPRQVKALLPRRWTLRSRDVFVEETLERLLALAGLPMPPQIE